MRDFTPGVPGSLAQPPFLPLTRAEMDRLGWPELDVLIVSGDAYVDHPSFGAALLGRWLVAHGFRTGIIAQPRWDATGGAEPAQDVARLGRPRLFAGVTAGCLDSMLAHYTAFRKKRSDDAFTPGGLAGARPNRAATVYANLVQRAFPGLPVVLGGIEASLRRASHYDFWSDSLRRSVLLDSKATAILAGMAETGILALARALNERRLAAGGRDPAPERGAARDLIPLLARIPGAVFAARPSDLPDILAAAGAARPLASPTTSSTASTTASTTASPAADPGQAEPLPAVELPSHEAIQADPKRLIKATLLLERQALQDRELCVQRSGDRLVVLSPPGPGLSGPELDALYALPFSRAAHPSYREPIPAASMILTSVNTHRGCAGGCGFCTLALHQGRRVRSRGRAAILAEIERVAKTPGFTGALSDVGGPSANMWGASCAGDPSACGRASCLTPGICPNFRCSQKAFVDLLEAAAHVPGVRHVRVASGWRMDLALTEPEALSRLIRTFVGGQAKVAPEHMSPRVLKLMRKPPFAVFEEFVRCFERESRQAGKEQYVIPYLMSAHPGCTLEDMRELSAWMRGRGWKPNQSQCFIPLPGTAAAAMFFAGCDLAGTPIPVARTDAERLAQHAALVPETGRGREGRGPGGKRGHSPGTSGPRDRSRPGQNRTGRDRP
jgi:uncharacterized radical SAM protein YgiQ